MWFSSALKVHLTMVLDTKRSSVCCKPPYQEGKKSPFANPSLGGVLPRCFALENSIAQLPREVKTMCKPNRFTIPFQQ
jgi:hypothetical protein